MKKLALVLLVLLGACGTPSAPDPKTTLLAIDQDFTKAATRVVAYEGLPRCTTTLVVNCGDQKVIDTLKVDVNDGDAKLDAAWKSLADPDIAAAGTARDTLKSDLSANHVQ